MAIRPVSANGFGLGPEAAGRNVEALARRTAFCDEYEVVSLRLRQLAGRTNPRRDAVVTLLAHGVGVVIIENAGDLEGRRRR